MEDGTPENDRVKGPRWALFLAWLGYFWALGGFIQMIEEYKNSLTASELNLLRDIDASAYLFPGLIHLLLGLVLMVFCMVRRLRGRRTLLGQRFCDSHKDGVS